MSIGRIWLDKVPVTVMPMGREVVLIGYDVLRHFDMILVPDAGVVGLMAAGTAPTAGQSVKLRLSDENSSLLVDVTADGKNDVARAVLTIDTGATITVFPSMSAMMAAVPVDLRFTAVTVAVHGEKLEPGRYGLRPLRVGGVDVGNVLAFEGSGSGGAIGLLGNDVLLRYRTTIVSADAPGGPRLLLAELPRSSPVRSCDQRTLRLGDDDGTPCLRVRIKSIDTTVRDTLQRAMVYDDSGMAAMEHATQAAAPPRQLRDDACLEVTIRRGLAKERIEFVVGDDAGVLRGAVLSVIANIAAEGNGSTTACLSLPDNTRLLGLKPDASLHLAAVRFDDDVDPALCEEGICHWYSGP